MLRNLQIILAVEYHNGILLYFYRDLGWDKERDHKDREYEKERERESK